MKKSFVSYTHSLLALGLLCVLLIGCASKPLPKEETLAHIMQLNQSGECAQAVKLALRFIEAYPDAITSEKCQVYYHLAYASRP